MKKLVLVMLLSHFAVLALAQKNTFTNGYYLNPQGDTVRGLIRFNFENPFDKTPEFKPTQEAPGQRLTPAQAQLIELEDGRYFVAQQVNLNNELHTVFLRRMAAGAVALYQLLNEQGIKEQFYLVRDARFTRINPIGLESFIRFYFNDCEAVSAKAKRYRATAGSLYELVTTFNQCIDPAYETTGAALLPAISFFLGGKLFYNAGYLELPRRLVYDFNQEKKYSFNSLGFGAIAGVRINKWQVLLEPSIVRHRTAQDSVAVGFVFINDYSNLQLDITQFELPILLQYHFSINDKWRIFPEAGVMPTFLTKARFEEEVIPSPVPPIDPVTPYINSFDNSRFAFGITSGLGLTRAISNRGTALIRARYNWIEMAFRQRPSLTDFQTTLLNRKLEVAIGYWWRL